MSDDDLHRARLAALEAEVKAASAVDQERKARARAQIEARRAAARAESDDLRARQAHLVRRKPGRDADDEPAKEPRAKGRDRSGDLGTALELARRAADAKHELSKPVGADEKSWMISGALSFFFGPVGWLYAGSWRESIPAAAGFLAVASVVSAILPFFLLMPVLMFAMPLSGIAGVVYAIGHNRAKRRIRLFGDSDDGKRDRRIGQIGSGDD